MSTKTISQNYTPLYEPRPYQKYPRPFILFCWPHQLWTALVLHPDLSQKLLGWRRISPRNQKIAHFFHQKNTTHQISISMLSFNTSFIYSCSIAVVSFFLTSGVIYICVMLILINLCLLNVIFSIPPRKVSIPPTFQWYWENVASLNARFTLFPLPFFISKLI